MLRLTPDTRHRIYLHAGLAYRQYYGETPPAVYNPGDPSKTQYDIDEGFKTFKFHGLLLSCRTIYAEASALLYSSNWFTIHYQPRRSLAPLRALTPSALGHLTNLKVVLNQTSCHGQNPGSGAPGSGGCCGDMCAYGQDPSGSSRHNLLPGGVVWHEYSHDLPLDGSGSLAQAVLVEWHATAAYHLASYIVPGQLELAFVCDVRHEDVETANLVLDSLRLLPRLKNCHIRLCGTRGSRLQHLAQEAALRARGIASLESPAPSRSFSPYLVNLPRELRLRILEYTDLVTPYKQVLWSRVSRGYCRQGSLCDVIDGSGHCKPEFHHGCQFNRCCETPWPQPSVGCFCRCWHTAFSSRCKCWAPPTPLFLVCRTLYSEASLVFYRENRFIVVDGPSRNPFMPWPPGDYPHESFAVSQFLRHVVPRHCLGYIRFLELAFAPFTPGHLSRPRDEHPALQDWSETLGWVKDKLNLPALTIRLVMAGSLDFPPEGSGKMTRAQGKEVLATYTRVLSPLQRLDPGSDGGLARFYAELAWPFRWTRWAASKLEWPKREQGWDWLKSKDRELKRRAEHFVMGERYERVSAAAGEPQWSVWTWVCLRHF